MRGDDARVKRGQHIYQGAYIVGRVKLAPQEMLAPIDAAVMGAPQDPRLSTTARGVELYRQFVNVNENGLHDVFCFADVVKDFQRDVQDKAVIAVEEDAEGVVMAAAQVGH